MATTGPRFFVLPHERVLHTDRLVGAWALEHLVVSGLFAIFLWGGLTTVLVLFAPDLLSAYIGLLVAAFVVHIGLSLVYVWRRLATTEYVVTAEAVYARRGQLILTVASALLDRVTDLHVHTSVVGRVFGYSGLSVRTAGGGVWLPGLRDAYGLRGTIQQARHELIAQLLREAGRTQERAAPSAPKRDVAPLGCPNCDLVFDAPRTRPLEVACPRCGERGAVFEEAAA